MFVRTFSTKTPWCGYYGQFVKFCLKLFTIIECSRSYKLETYIQSDLFAILIYAAVPYMYDTLYAILKKSENATLQYSIFCEKVFDEKYLLKLNNVFQTSSKWFVEFPPICLFWSLSYVPFVFNHSKVVLLLWIICVIYVLCLSCFHICSLLPCGHLPGKGWPLGSCLWCLSCFCHFPMWYPWSGV